VIRVIQRFITLIGLVCVCLSLTGGIGPTLSNSLAKSKAALSSTSSWPGVPGVLAGPVMARVIRVYDGDTILVRARIWVDQEIEIRVRLAGVDTPEIKGQCAGFKGPGFCDRKNWPCPRAASSNSLWEICGPGGGTHHDG
jgi:endonuclease YncB( thermonuclease family)